MRRRIARAISIGAHPFVMVPLVVALTVKRTLPRAQGAVVLGGLLAILATLVGIVVISVRRGAFTDVDISRREQRPAMYAVTIAATCAVTAIFWRLELPAPVIHATLIALGMIVALAIFNIWLKVSLHTAFAVYTAAIASDFELTLGGFVLGVALAVAWSRVELERHTRAEVLMGLAIGACAVVAQQSWR